MAWMGLRARLISGLPGGVGPGSLAGDTGIVLLVQLISRGALNIVTLLAAHFLSVAQFSSYNYFLITTGLLASLLAVGLPVAATKIVSGRARQPGADYEAQLSALAALFAGTVLLGVAASPLYLALLDPSEVEVSRTLLLVGGIAFAAFAIANAGMQGARAFRATLAPVAFGSLCLVAGTILAWSTRSETPLFWGVVAFYAVPVALFLRFLGRIDVLKGRSLWRRPTRPALAAVAATALPSLGVAVIFSLVNWLIGRTLVEHQVSPDGFAQFAIGMQWFALALFVPIGLGQAVFPRYVDVAHGRRLTGAMVVQPAAAAFGMAMLLLLVAVPLTPFLSPIYGGNYDFSRLFVFLMLLAACFAAPAGVLGQAIIAAKGAGAWLKVYLTYLALGAAGPLLWPLETPEIAAGLLCLANFVLFAAASLSLALPRWRHRATTRR